MQPKHVGESIMEVCKAINKSIIIFLDFVFGKSLAF